MSRRAVPRHSSGEDDHLTSPAAVLSPPRPFFVHGASSDRGSWSGNESADAASDSDSPPSQLHQVSSPPRKPRNHTRKRSSMAAYAPVEPDTPNPFDPNNAAPSSPAWSPSSLYDAASNNNNNNGRAAPPSSYMYPFQSHPGNADPLPTRSRRSSVDSMNRSTGQHGAYQSVEAYSGEDGDLARPYAPFMASASREGGGGGGQGGAGPGSSAGSVYRDSVAGSLVRSGSSQGMHEPMSPGMLPRSGSASFRAPFLSPASRPTSNVWTPPQYALYGHAPGAMSGSLSPSASAVALGLALPGAKEPLPSTALVNKLSKEDKPWLLKKDPRVRASYWITLGCFFLGVLASAAVCYVGYTSVMLIPDSDLCLVFEDDFSGSSLDTSNWNFDNQMGGFGNGEFQMTTNSSTNVYIQDSQLYIYPTLTADSIGGWSAVINGSGLDSSTYTLSDCTTDNSTACSATAQWEQSVINPVMSARINTQGLHTIKYGKVEVKAKLPTGDWLWPAIWMLPENNSYYGPGWPINGEIDIMEARGNGLSYTAQGSNYVRSSLNYGPMDSLTRTLYGWVSQKRTSYADGFHTYTLEWDDQFMRFYTDSRVSDMLTVQYKNSKSSFWNRAGFPSTAQNGSSEVVVTNPYANSGDNSAPFDQDFYLLIDLAVGGTSGWFPDGVGNKPWYDGSTTAMFDFAQAHDTWYATWPSSADDRAFRIDSVKMYNKCK